MIDLRGKNIVVLDLEVANSPDELPTGWEDKRALGLSLGGYWDYQESRIVWFDTPRLEETVGSLVARQPLLVSFHGLQFDFVVMRALLRAKAEQLDDSNRVRLQTLCDQFKALCTTGYDILQAVWAVAGRGSERGLNSLDALCTANQLGSKYGNGALAPKLWQQGEVAAVLNYCTQDILLTKALFELLLDNNGTIQRRDRPLTVALPVLP